MALFHNSGASNFAIQQNAQGQIGIRINGGSKYTNKRDITVEIKALKIHESLIESMKICFDKDLDKCEWIPYSESKIQKKINGSEGKKTIYVQFRDKSGNTSPIESDFILYDTTPPKIPKIAINSSEVYTNDKLGRVLVKVQAEEAHELFISNSPYFQNGQWQPYTESIKWVIDISRGDGEKLVYVKFRDQAGNETEAINDMIILDTDPPTGKIQINEGENYTRSRRLRLTLTSYDATKARIVCGGVGKNYDFDKNQNGKLEVFWELDSAQGKKTILAYFMDEAKNTTKTPSEASIIYNSTPPAKVTIEIDRGKEFTNDPNGIVSLALTSNENPANISMQISNFPNFENAYRKSFAPIVNNWQLDHAEDGLKSIYVRLIDPANNYSEISKAEIILDRSPPVVHSFNINENNEWSNSLNVTLISEVDDAVEAQYSNSNNPNTLRNAPWEEYQKTRPDWNVTPGDGLKTIFARFKDEAGNIAITVSDEILLDLTPPMGTLVVNDGSQATNDPEGNVKLQITYDKDVMGMLLANSPDFAEVKLLPIMPTIEKWKLESVEDGLKTIYLKVKDKAGNLSPLITSSIILDRKPIQDHDFSINNNSSFTTNKDKKVSISMNAPKASWMMISNNPTMQEAEWIPYKNTIPWYLSGPEGPHQVYVKFKDIAGNESDIISKTIVSDFWPPKITHYSINGNAEYCNDAQGNITLNFEAEDAYEIAISNSQIIDTSLIRGRWEKFQPSISWKLEGEDGLKVVYFRFKDKAGNITKQFYSKVILDRKPPQNGKITINKGAEWLSDQNGNCEIDMFAYEAIEIMLSNTPEFTNGKWEPMTSNSKAWKCNLGSPLAEVYAKFRDKAGNESAPVQASIKIDASPPSKVSISIDNGAKYVFDPNNTIELNLQADGATKMRISQTDNFSGVSWEPFIPSKKITLNEDDGLKTFYAQFSDDANNISSIAQAKIILDTTPPKIHLFIINNGEEWTNSPEKNVVLSVDAEDAKTMMLSNQPDFRGASWESFSPTIRNYRLTGEDGEKVIYIKLKDEKGNETKPYSAKINLKRTF